MITPQQNAEVADYLEELYFHKDLNLLPVSHSDLKHKTLALIKGDRKLAEFEKRNRYIESVRKASIYSIYC